MSSVTKTLKTKVESKVSTTKVATTSAAVVADENEDGVLITDDTKRKEGKTALKTAIRALIKGPKGGKGKGSLGKVLKVWLWYRVTATSAAATAQAPVFQLFISNSAEAADAVDMFDEFKVVKGKFIYNVSGSTSSNGYDIAVAYDPANAGAFSSIAAALPSKYHKLTGTSGSFIQPIPYHSDAHWTFNFTMPKGSFSDTGGASATGDWTDCANSASADYGFIKCYLEAPSAGTSQIIGHVGLLTEFRMRS